MLRPYQDELLGEGRRAMQAGARRVIFQLPTGGGKTHIIAALAYLSWAKGKRVLILVHRRRLVRQICQRLQEFGVPFGVLMAGLSEFQGEPWVCRDGALAVQVASRDTLLSRAVRNDWIGFPPADLVIVDECHNAISPAYASLLSHYPLAWIAGFTATPARPDGTGLGDYFQALVCGPPPSALIAGGWIVPVRCYGPELTHEGRRPKGLSGDPVSHWERLAGGRPTVLFTARVSESRALCRRFSERGYLAEHVDARSEDAKREDVYQSLEAGDTSVIGNVGILTEGVDIPALACCQLVRAADSYVFFAQAVGRVMRSVPGKADAVLIDHAGAVYAHGFPDDDAEWTLDPKDTIERRHGAARAAGKRKSPICCPECFLLYTGKQCPSCGAVVAFKPKPDKPPTKRDALLVEVARQRLENPAALLEAQSRYWQMCLGVTATRGQRLAVASTMFHNRFGQWPGAVAGLAYPPPPGCQQMPTAVVFPGFNRKRPAPPPEGGEDGR